MNQPSPRPSTQVFLSHSSVDKDLARRLALDLRSANIEVWLDEWELAVGAELDSGIKRGVDECDFVIVLLTPACVDSQWVDLEWRRKLEAETESEKVSIVPVRGEPCEIPDFLAQRSYADISGGSYPFGFRHLLEILRYYSKDNDIVLPEVRFTPDSFSRKLLAVVTPVALEVSSDLIPLFEEVQGESNRILHWLLPAMREKLCKELGFPFPGVRVRGNESDMPAGSALILIDEIPEVMLAVKPDRIVVNGALEPAMCLDVTGIAFDDPLDGCKRTWISPEDRNRFAASNRQSWDAAEYLCLALEVVLTRIADLFIDIDTAYRLLEPYSAAAAEKVKAVVPARVSWIEFTDVLCRLVAEGIGVGRVGDILDAIAPDIGVIPMIPLR